MHNTNTFMMEVKAFKFNRSGVCENPNVIFRTTNPKVKDDYPDQTPQSFTIKTAKGKDGLWVYGYAICGRDFSYHAPCTINSIDTFENETAAINAAIGCIKQQMKYEDKQNTDPTPAYDRGLKKLLAEVHIDNLQLSLF